jgi:hypothetical protein
MMFFVPLMNISSDLTNAFFITLCTLQLISAAVLYLFDCSDFICRFLYVVLLVLNATLILKFLNILVLSSGLCVQTGSGAHPASCPIGTGGNFPGGKARPGRDTDHSPPSSAEVKNE